MRRHTLLCDEARTVQKALRKQRDAFPDESDTTLGSIPDIEARIATLAKRYGVSSYDEPSDKAARFTPALSGCAAVPNGVQVAAVAGGRQRMVSALGLLQRAVSRIALVHDGRCLNMICVGTLHVNSRVMRGFGTSKFGLRGEWSPHRNRAEIPSISGNFGIRIRKNRVVFVFIKVR